MATHLTSSRDPRVKEVHASSFRLGREFSLTSSKIQTTFEQDDSASTSAANFGLLLVALVLMLHSVLGELAPRHVRHHLFARGDSSDKTRDYSKGFDISKKLMIKDDTMKDFTINKFTDSFEIRYPNHGGVRLQYWYIDPLTGCKFISIFRGGNSGWRIWVSDEVGNDRDIDTQNAVATTKRLCSKWIHIHIKKDFRPFNI
ncbi:related to Mig1 protein, induced during biotrophic phase [Ustilago sp. UG-2017b]|nr:related to Mig1 protein, induced during biotrophic phase [Ustilago sp. UG-2017b]